MKPGTRLPHEVEILPKGTIVSEEESTDVVIIEEEVSTDELEEVKV